MVGQQKPINKKIEQTKENFQKRKHQVALTLMHYSSTSPNKLDGIPHGPRKLTFFKKKISAII